MTLSTEQLAAIDEELEAFGKSDEEISGVISRAQLMCQEDVREALDELDAAAPEMNAAIEAAAREASARVRDLVGTGAYTNGPEPRVNGSSHPSVPPEGAEEDFMMLVDEDILEIVEEDEGDNLELDLNKDADKQGTEDNSFIKRFFKRK